MKESVKRRGLDPSSGVLFKKNQGARTAGMNGHFLPRILLDLSGKFCYNNHRVTQSCMKFFPEKIQARP